MYVNVVSLHSSHQLLNSQSNLIFQSDGKSTVETNESGEEDIMYVEQKPLYNQNNVDDEEQFEALLQQLGLSLIHI